jgi:two-component system response regulator FixJ
MRETEPVVYVIDDDESVRSSLTRLVEVVGRKVETFACGQDFLDVCESAMTGCILLDVRMPGMSGLALQGKLEDRQCNLPIIFITGHGDVSTATEAFKNGAVDFFEKPFNSQKVLDSIDKAIDANLEMYSKKLKTDEIKARIDALSPREYEVMGKIVEAKTNKVIALELGLSPKTVDFHRSNVMEKMGVNGAVQLTTVIMTAKGI